MVLRTTLTPFCLAALAACTAAPGGVAESFTDRTAAPPAQPVVIPIVASTPAVTRGPLPAAGHWDSPQQQLVPLRADDVRLYLGVMRAAAGRVRHPTAQDLAALHSAQAWGALMDAAPAMQARPPAPLSEAALERSANLEGHMADVEVASERGIDLGRYQWIRDTIEAIAEPTATGTVAACGHGESCGATTMTAPPGQPGFRRALALTTARDRRLLAPDLAEIRALDAVVRAQDRPVASAH